MGFHRTFPSTSLLTIFGQLTVHAEGFPPSHAMQYHSSPRHTDPALQTRPEAPSPMIFGQSVLAERAELHSTGVAFGHILRYHFADIERAPTAWKWFRPCPVGLPCCHVAMPLAIHSKPGRRMSGLRVDTAPLFIPEVCSVLHRF